MSDLTTLTMTAFVPGLPRPQGSMRAFKVGNRVSITHAKGGELGVWRSACATAFRDVWGDTPPLDEPVVVVIDFFLPRPASAPKRVQMPARKPDIDKLVRAVLDSLTDAQVLTDDARVVTLSASKFFASPIRPLGARVQVRVVEPIL
jgi:Holliday junction resolvase RusA-like endonuclease